MRRSIVTTSGRSLPLRIEARLVQSQGERRERRLEAVAEVGDVPAGALQVGGVLVEQRVQFRDEGPDLARLRPRDPLRPAGPDPNEVGPKERQGPEAEADLEQDAADQRRRPAGAA